MDIKDITEDKLNMFIDEQLDNDEMEFIRNRLLEDKVLREQVCQLKAVRELVGYAYSDVPQSRAASESKRGSRFFLSRAVAATVILMVGVIVGWLSYEFNPLSNSGITADNTFQYIANYANVDHKERRIILHIDSSDIKVVDTALNEANQLLASYRAANTPMKLEVVTNKSAINILRPDISPYIKQIQTLIDDHDVEVYACERSIMKAHKKEGVEIVLLPGVRTDKTARELIPERLERGWVYIRA